MLAAPLLDPVTEAARQRSVASYGLDATYLHSIACTAGLQLAAVDLADSLCHRVLDAAVSGEPLVRLRITSDPQLCGLPWSVDDQWNGIESYIAVPLLGREGLLLGVPCVLSGVLVEPTAEQLTALAVIGDAVMLVLETARVTRDADSVAPVRTGGRATVGPKHWTIDAVIDEGAVRTLFQPVLHLASGSVTGFEALSRGPVGSELESPMAMLGAAAEVGRLAELDWLCRGLAVEAAGAAGFDPVVTWFVNVESAAVAVPRPQHLLRSWAIARRDLRIVGEMVERDIEGNVFELLLATDRARLNSWGMAMDDVGAVHSSLALLPLFSPDVIKLDATYGQGYLYGRPGPLPRRSPPADAPDSVPDTTGAPGRPDPVRGARRQLRPAVEGPQGRLVADQRPAGGAQRGFGGGAVGRLPAQGILH